MGQGKAFQAVVRRLSTDAQKEVSAPMTMEGLIVGYLTPDSDLDLAPDLDQFGALPPVRYINL